ncbi:MAG TPA: cytochrome c oxidase subunit 3 [Dokdonella sp.]|uniref:cytochrome c oxidase subunit 3 n=1 Tax=Dokdonella sp. TaxID=2291710 RepID=UPI002D7F9FE0|nr:cytochrome c oxidase subunit 3 [Dokdonella sp.]HET9032569.1 cytochrome c oxidase subunit 3 [Dokdonella sp.]
MNATKYKHAGLNLGTSDPGTHEQAESPLFGFWVFLMSDAVIFSLLFAIYLSMLDATAGGPSARDLFELKSAFIQTLILLTSSFTFAMASLNLKYRADEPRRLISWLAITLLLGLIFIGFEVHDLLGMAARDALPQRSGFLSAFFVLVPTHGIHVAFGCLWLIVMIIQIATLGLRSEVKTRIMRLGLFWHFLDIIWIGIFSVVYLWGLL